MDNSPEITVRQEPPQEPPKVRKKRPPLFYALLALAALIALSFLVCRVTTVEVQPSDASSPLRYYTEDEIRQAVRIGPFSLIDMIVKPSTEDILKKLPCLTNASVSVSLRSAVIHVTETPRIYKTTDSGMLLSDSLRIIPANEKFSSGAAELAGVSFKPGSPGETAVAVDQGLGDRLVDIITALAELPTLDGKVRLNITKIDLTNRVRISVTHDDRVKIILGRDENLSAKLSAARELITRKELQDPAIQLVIYATGGNWYYVDEVHTMNEAYVPAQDVNMIDGYVQVDDIDSYSDEEYYEENDDGEDEYEEEEVQEEDEEEEEEEEEEAPPEDEEYAENDDENADDGYDTDGEENEDY